MINEFIPTIRLCALGARVCYSDQKIEEIIEDGRVNGDGLQKYLENIFKMKHFSVFSHSFFYYKGAIEKKEFKMIESDESTGISLRHLLEKTDKFPDISNLNIPKIEILNKRNSEEIECNLLHYNKNDKGWIVLHIDGVTRITSHQAVRYTSLNFSQRSQRYCSEKNNFFIMPYFENIAQDKKEKAIEIINEHYNLSKKIYEELMSIGIKKEDARYVLPSAARTSFLMSGTIENVNHFINQRTQKDAQTEIRKLAYCMRDCLNG